MRLFLRHPVSFLIPCTAILLHICDVAYADNETELDWHETSDSSQCRGSYEEPVIDSETAINASADSAVHV